MAHILTEIREGVLTITLNREEVLNSFNRVMAAELMSALTGAAKDAQVRAVLLTGAGRAFCAGQDLADVKPNEDLGGIVHECYNPIIRAIRNLEKPVVCAVNGVAAGAGANLAIACDITFASKKASFIQSFSKIGLIPDSGGTFFLPRLVGLQRATALTFLGEKLGAEEAERIGLIYKAVEPEELQAKAFETAKYLASQPTRGFALTKSGFNQSAKNDLNAQLEVERGLQTAAGKTADYNEGVRAFLDKRAPQFTGK